jgi:glycosyltransferase involved in cell wall biosynthesis
MQRLLASGTVLVNPRLSSERENRFNFPSKILDYLASGRPVVTTLAGDLDAVYRRIAIPLLEETPESLARLLVDLCSRPERELAEMGARGRDFVLSERRWGSQGRRVYDLVERVIGDRRP